MIPVSLSTVSPLHMNIQGADFQGCECAFHQHHVRVKLPLALCLLSLMILQLYHLPPPPPPPSVTLLACSLDASPCVPDVVLYFSRSRIVWLKLLFCISCVCFLCIICVKSIINLFTVQSYVADCLSWAPKLTSWGLGTDWTYECTLGMELVPMWGTYCIWNNPSFVAVLLAPQALE